MRHLKKLLAVIVAICVLATFTVPAFAQDVKTDAEICEILGILKGTTSGVDAEYLAKGTTRIQAVILSLRLADKEEEAYEFEGTDNFADANEVQWAEGQKALAYVKAHPELGWVGSTSGKFFPYEAATPQMIYKVLLEVLGYKQDVDFTWGETLEFAAQVGLVKVADVSKMTNNDMAIAIVEALQTKVKDSEKTLIETLVEAGVISAEKAAEVGLIAGELTVSVAATGAKKLTVSFNRAVDTSKAKITVKKGSVTVSTDKIEFAADKKSAVITTTTKLTEGEYTVTVSGLTDEALTASVKVENEKVSKINITSSKAPRKTDDTTSPDAKYAKVDYEVLNQYGENMTNVDISWTVSTGKPVANEDKTNCFYYIESADGNAFIPGTIVYITGVHAASGTVVNAQVEVALASAPDSVVFKGVYDTSKKEIVDLPADFADSRYVLLFEVQDQYGNKMSAERDAGTTPPSFKKLVFTSSNPLFVASSFEASDNTYTVDDVTYQAVKLKRGTSPEKGGSVTISVISTATGKTSTFTISAEAAAVLKKFTMSAPASIIAEGEDVEIPFEAYDQYGNVITKYDDLNGKVTFTPWDGTNGLRLVQQSDGSAKLKFKAKDNENATPTADAYVYLTSLVAEGGDFSSVMITIKDKAVPTAIVGIESDKGTHIAVGNSIEVTYADLIIQDQYGRTMKDSDVAAWLDAGNNKIKVVSVSGGVIKTYLNTETDESTTINLGKTDKVKIEAVAGDGSTEKIVFSLVHDGTESDESAKSLTFTKVTHSEYASYEIVDLGVMYNDATGGTATDSAYDKIVTVKGVLADGTKVTLPKEDYTVETDGKLDVNDNVISDVGTSGYDADEFEDGDITVTVLVTVIDRDTGAAFAILEKEMKVSNKAPKIVAAEFSDDVTDGKAILDAPGGTISNAALLGLLNAEEIKDQYGVDAANTIADADPTITITNLVKVDGSSLTVSNNGKVDAAISGAKMGDKFTVTFKWAGGFSVKVDVTVGLDS